MKTRTLVVHVTLIVALVAALSAGALSAPQPGGRAVISLWAFPTRLVGSVEIIGWYIFSLIHDTLTSIDTPGQVHPRLAERWERSADGKTWTLHLRDARFHDGRPVAAEDVKFTYEFHLHPRFPFTQAALLEIEGARAYKDGKASEVTGLQVVNPRTIRFVLTRRFALFLEQITGTPHYIMPRHALAGVDVGRVLEHPYARRPIGAGPYRLVDWRERESMVLQAFPGHWEGRPAVERVILRFVPEPGTVMAELRSGHLDAGLILPDEFEAFQRERNLQVLRMVGDHYYWFAFNHRHPFFGDVRVRRALWHAVDRETMVRVLHKGYGRVVSSPIHPVRWQFNTALKNPPYDPERARALLREAGFTPEPGGVLQRDSRPFRVKYSFLAEKRYQDQALMVQQFLRQVGIEITLEVLERGDFFGRFFQVANAPNIEMVGLSHYDLASSVPTVFDGLYGSSGIWARNIQYQNREIDALLDQAATATDRGALKTMYFRVQELIVQDVPRVITFRPDDLVAVRRTFALPKIDSMVEFYRSIPRWKGGP